MLEQILTGTIIGGIGVVALETNELLNIFHYLHKKANGEDTPFTRRYDAILNAIDDTSRITGFSSCFKYQLTQFPTFKEYAQRIKSFYQNKIKG